MHYLRHAKDKFNFYLYAFVLIGNHYHLLLETTQPNLAQIMHFGLSYSSVSKTADSLKKQLQRDEGLQKEIDDIVSRFKG